MSTLPPLPQLLLPLLLPLLLAAASGGGAGQLGTQHNASCVGGGSLACNSSAAACCNVGSYEPELRCFDPAAQRCCSYGGGPGGPAAASLCGRSAASQCCAQLCYDPESAQCCHDQYGEGHTCKLAESCQINGCGPAPPTSGSWCSPSNATGRRRMAVTIDSEGGTLSLTTEAGGCAGLKYTYDASGEFPGQGEMLLHSSPGTHSVHIHSVCASSLSLSLSLCVSLSLCLSVWVCVAWTFIGRPEQARACHRSLALSGLARCWCGPARGSPWPCSTRWHPRCRRCCRSRRGRPVFSGSNLGRKSVGAACLVRTRTV